MDTMADKRAAQTFLLGGDPQVRRPGHGTMQITGIPRDEDAA